MDDIDFSNVCIQPEDVDYVIYHSSCVDGFGSALSAYVFFKNNNGEQPKYHAGKFGILPNLEEVKNKNVLICDFSYKKDQLNFLKTITKNLLILDHHKTAEEDLRELPESNKIFRMDHSGAYITWRYFFRNGPVPLAIRYIEDNDIWKKSMPNTYEFTAFIFTLPYEFQNYEKLLDDDYVINVAIPEGIGMVKQNKSIVSRMVEFTAPKFVSLDGKYYFVCHLNSTELRSEIGNALLKKYQNMNFSVVYWINDEESSTSYSLRSVDNATDVSEIAKKLNGGGHRNASGASIGCVTNKLPVKILDSGDTYNILNHIVIDNFEISEDKIYKIVMLNSSHYKKELAKYLLQIRYKDSSGKTVQECASIIKNRDGTICNDNYEISCVWNYDGYKNCKHYTLYCNNPELYEPLKNKLSNSQFNNFEYLEGGIFVYSF